MPPRTFPLAGLAAVPPAILAAAPTEASVTDDCRLQDRFPGASLAPVEVFTGPGETQWSSLLATGDLDGDGIDDLVAIERGVAEPFAVLLGLGDGAFAPAIRFGDGEDVAAIDVGDLDGDGVLDLVHADDDAEEVAVRLGDGTGGFGPRLPAIPLGVGPRGVTVSDLDGDGVPDLVVSSSEMQGATVLLGGGDGTFGAAAVYPASGANGVLRYEVADLDGDGAVDLVGGTFAGPDGVLVFPGNGDGTFGGATSVDGFEVYAVAIADLNGDGVPDLATAADFAQLRVLLGAGDGTFTLSDTHVAGERPRGIAAADLDGDGALDLAVSSSEEDVVSVFFGRGDGTFESERRFPSSVAPGRIVRLDLGGSDADDVAVLERGGKTIGRLVDPNRARPTIVPTGDGPRDLRLQDVDGDARPDLVLIAANDGALEVHPGDGEGGFGSPLVSGVGLVPEAYDLADLDGDGLDDLAVVGTVQALRARRGLGDGTFAEQIASIPLEFGFKRVLAGDVDGDGDRDLVVSLSQVAELAVLLNDGAADFVELPRIPTGPQPTLGALADLDLDGVLDVACTTSGDRIALFFGLGDGTFAPPVELAAGIGVGAIEVADLDGDGRPDLVNASFSTDEIVVRLGAGGGAFLGPKVYRTGGGPSDIDAADIDGDGRLDLVVATPGTQDVTILRNLGGGAFTVEGRLWAGVRSNGNTAGWVALDDLDRDGDVDLVTARSVVVEDDTFWILPNDCPPLFGDLDGDGCVGFADLVALLSYWAGGCGDPGGPVDAGEPCPADLDGDGVVGTDDLVLLLSAYTGCD